MAIFQFRAFDATGEDVQGQIEAATAKSAAELLHKRGLLAYQTEETSRGSSLVTRLVGARRRGRMTPRDFADFSRQLATLLKAGLPVDQALRLLAGKGRLSAFATELVDLVVGGRGLSAAIGSAAPEAPMLVVPIVRAGEARGTLVPALTDLADILDRRVELRNRLRSAFIYPGILLLVAMFAIGIVVGVLVPTLLPLFADNGATPPALLKLAGDFGQILSQYWPALFTAGALLIGAIVFFARLPATRRHWSLLILRLPLIGLLVRRVNIALLSRTLGTLLRNGVPLVSALALSASVVTNAQFAAAIKRATEAVKEGKKLSATLRQSHLFSDLSLQFIAVGENSSKLDDMLLHLADVEDAQSQRQIETFLTLLTPAITLVVGGIVAGLILSVMQAVLSVNEIVR
jgi:general secretion pathway protein F